MSFFGDLLGYDRNGYDLLGSHQDPQNNCPICGRGAMIHSPQQEAICLQKLYAKPEPPK